MKKTIIIAEAGVNHNGDLEVAKKLVDACPSKIKENITPVEAEEHKKTLTAAGAEVEIK